MVNSHSNCDNPHPCSRELLCLCALNADDCWRLLEYLLSQGVNEFGLSFDSELKDRVWTGDLESFRSFVKKLCQKTLRKKKYHSLLQEESFTSMSFTRLVELCQECGVGEVTNLANSQGQESIIVGLPLLSWAQNWPEWQGSGTDEFGRSLEEYYCGEDWRKCLGSWDKIDAYAVMESVDFLRPPAKTSPVWSSGYLFDKESLGWMRMRFPRGLFSDKKLRPEGLPPHLWVIDPQFHRDGQFVLGVYSEGLDRDDYRESPVVVAQVTETEANELNKMGFVRNVHSAPWNPPS